MKKKKKRKTYPVHSGFGKDVTLGIAFYAFLGLILGTILISWMVASIWKVIFIASAGLLAVKMGWDYDFIRIPKEKIAGVYNALDMQPLYNVSGGVVWKMFGLKKIGKLFNRTVDPLIIEVISSVTSDDIEVDVTAKANYQLIDALFIETEVGDDSLDILKADLYNSVDGTIKRETLDELERNVKEGDLQEELEKDLRDIFSSFGYELGKIVVYNIRSDASIRKARQGIKIAEWEMKRKALQQEKKDEIIHNALKRMKEIYAEMGRLDEFNPASVMKDIMIMMDEYSQEQIITLTGVNGDANLVETLVAGLLKK